MATVSLNGSLVRTGEHRTTSGVWVVPPATARRPRAGVAERLSRAITLVFTGVRRVVRPRHAVLLAAAALAAVAAGRTGFMIDVSGAAGVLTLSTGAVQVGILVAASLIELVVASVTSRIASARREAALARSVADLQAQAHRLQLQPHFVFNALQAAATLVHRDAVKADLMLVALGDFLRLTLQTAESREIPLVTELALLDRYVEVMGYRFGDQVRVTVDAAPDTLDARVPQLILQPLVENAIRHGLRENGCRVTVRIRRDGDTLRCLVHDDGRGLRPGARPNGIGLRSTRGRLEALYGARGEFRLADDPAGGVAATVSLPFHTLDDERAA